MPIQDAACPRSRCEAILQYFDSRTKIISAAPPLPVADAGIVRGGGTAPTGDR